MIPQRDRRRVRMAVAAMLLAVVVVAAGCAGVGDGAGEGTNETTQEQVTEPPVETTAEPTDAPTDEPPETDAPPATDAPGEGGDGDTGDEGPNDQTTLLLGALAVFVVGFVAAGLLRSRSKRSAAESSRETTPASEPRSDSERVISLLHRNNGRMFQDVLEEELDWSPAHTRRVVDGLVATGDVERKETDTGWLVVFTDPNRPSDEE